MSNQPPWTAGATVLVPWGLAEPRRGTIIKVWGDPSSPTNVLVELDEVDPDPEVEPPPPLLFSPDLLTLAS